MGMWKKAILLFFLCKIIDFVLATNECPVCLEIKILTMTKCGHSICETCLNELLEKKHSCPECREDLNQLSPIINKIKKNQIEGAKFILKRRPASVNEENEFQETPLTDAIKCENMSFLNLLIEYKADLNLPNGKGEIPYVLAHENDHQWIKFLLFEHGANITNELMSELFFEAVEIGDMKILTLAVQKGQNVMETKNNKSALMMIARKGDVKMANILIDIVENKKEILEQQDENANTPLMHAVEFDENLSVVELLLETGLDVKHANKKTRTPFMIAVIAGSVKIVELFIKKFPEIMEQVDIFENTALIYAVSEGKEFVVKFLLEKDVNVRHQNKEGKTALMFAAEKGYVKIVDLLIKKDRTTITQISNTGEYTLGFAILNNKISVVKYFADYCYEILPFSMIQSVGERAKKYSTKMKKTLDKFVLPENVMDAVKLNDLGKLKYALKKYPETLNEQNKNYETPLLVAVKNNQESIVGMLVHYKNTADLNQWNSRGETALVVAAKMKNWKLIWILFKARFFAVGLWFILAPIIYGWICTYYPDLRNDFVFGMAGFVFFYLTCLSEILNGWNKALAN